MKKKILCVGDSHSEPVCAGLNTLLEDTVAIGGPLPRKDYKWVLDFHAGDDKERHLTLPEMQEGLENYLRPHRIDASNLLTIDIPAVYSFLTPHFLFTAVHHRVAEGVPGTGMEAMSRQLLDEVTANYLLHSMELFCALKAANAHFVSIIGPAPNRNFAHFGPAFLRTQEAIMREHDKYGIPYADVTERTTTPDGVLLPEYIPDVEIDYIHGNNAWGIEVAKEVIRIMGL